MNHNHANAICLFLGTAFLAALAVLWIAVSTKSGQQSHDAAAGVLYIAAHFTLGWAAYETYLGIKRGGR